VLRRGFGFGVDGGSGESVAEGGCGFGVGAVDGVLESGRCEGVEGADGGNSFDELANEVDVDNEDSPGFESAAVATTV